jgi:hypothetical protein
MKQKWLSIKSLARYMNGPWKRRNEEDLAMKNWNPDPILSVFSAPFVLFCGHSVIVNPPGHLISVQPASHGRPGNGGSNPVKPSQTKSNRYGETPNAGVQRLKFCKSMTCKTIHGQTSDKLS